MSEKAAATGDSADLSKLTVEQLYEAYLLADDESARITAYKTEILKTVEALVKPELDGKFQATQKTHGTASYTVGNAPFNYEIKKEVKWDTNQLKTLYDLMPGKAQEVVKVEMSIPEKTFHGLTVALDKDSPAMKQIMAARTVIFSPPKITFVK